MEVCKKYWEQIAEARRRGNLWAQGLLPAAPDNRQLTNLVDTKSDLFDTDAIAQRRIYK